MTELLFYKKPVPLDRNKHRALKFKASANYSFASHVNTVPLSGPEFFQCSRNHPVMFVKTAAGGFLPAALLSFDSQMHRLSDTWDGVYVPTFIKRYPFALAENKDIIMIDESASHFSEDGERLFDDSGEPTPVFHSIIKYLDELNLAHSLTLDYTKALKAKGLLSPCKHVIKMPDREIKLDNFYVVSERELHESLTKDEVADWFLKGWLAWTYAHIHSIGSISEIIKRMTKKAG